MNNEDLNIAFDNNKDEKKEMNDVIIINAVKCLLRVARTNNVQPNWLLLFYNQCQYHLYISSLPKNPHNSAMNSRARTWTIKNHNCNKPRKEKTEIDRNKQWNSPVFLKDCFEIRRNSFKGFSFTKYFSFHKNCQIHRMILSNLISPCL